LVFWPSPLVFDYGAIWVVPAARIACCTLLMVLLLVGTAIALARRPALGFLGAWFFAILAPSSSVVPLPWQTMAEHRMYLPLASVVTLTVCATYAAVDRIRNSRRVSFSRVHFALLFSLAAALCWLTVRRNEVYQSALALWGDTVANGPENPRAEFMEGILLERIPGRLPEAVACYEQALNLAPDYAEAHNNLGHALMGIRGRMPEALAHYERALRLKSDFPEALNNLGVALVRSGRTEEAIEQFEKAVRRRPDFPEAEDNLGSALASSGHIPRALSVLGGLVRRRPDFAEAHNNYGLALAQAGRLPEAIGQCREALTLDPDDAEAQRNLDILLQALRRNP
jgi:tetratricopeptide (TPR) repeat protein